MSVTNRALWFIEAHLDSELPLDSIAEAAGVSRFHLSRAFALNAGLPLSAYIRTRRLTGAAKSLAAGAADILSVALEAGYNSHEAFTRAFRQHFELTPEQVRERASLDHLPLQEPIRLKSSQMQLDAPRIVTSGPLLIFGLSERYGGSIAGIPSQWNRFVPYLGQIGNQAGPATYGVIYNGDETGAFDYLSGVEVSAFPTQPAEFTRLRIAPQRYAVFEHRDHVSSVNATFQAIWDHALAANGLAAAEAPCFERYGERFNGHTGMGGLEIWIPVR